MNSVIAKEIDFVLDEELRSKSCLLFSLDEIRAKVWAPADFLNEMFVQIEQRSKRIGEKFLEVQQRFREVEENLKSPLNDQKSRSSTSSTRRSKSISGGVTNEAMRSFVNFYLEKMIDCTVEIVERTLKAYLDLTLITETKYLTDQTKLIRFLFEGQTMTEFESTTDLHRIRFDLFHETKNEFQRKFLVF